MDRRLLADRAQLPAVGEITGRSTQGAGQMMRLGDLLIGQGLCTSADIEAALAHQRRHGGRLGTSLVALGVLTVEQLLDTLRSQQEVGAALQLCARTLQRWEGAYGANHPNTNRARYNLARALLIAGRAADSMVHAEAAFAGHIAALGPDHAWTRESGQLAANVRHVIARNQDAPKAAAEPAM
jgi:hypothetical protein